MNGVPGIRRCEDVPGDTDQQQYKQVARVVYVKHQANNGTVKNVKVSRTCGVEVLL
jgi:hypothetical protein